MPRRFCRDLVEDGTVYAFLADHRDELFKDEDFADLFPSGRGRPSIPVEVICSVMVLQALEGPVGPGRDPPAAQPHRLEGRLRARPRRRGLRLHHPHLLADAACAARRAPSASSTPCAPSSTRPACCRASTAGRSTRPSSTTPSPPRTPSPSSSRRCGGCSSAVPAARPRSRSPRLHRRSASRSSTGPTTPSATASSPCSSTTPIDLLDAVGDDSARRRAEDALGMLALVAAQDVEPGETDGTWRIARQVAKDRVISTVDPEARHGHKSVLGAQGRLQGAPRLRARHRHRHRRDDHAGERPRRAGRCRAHGRRARRPRGPRRLRLWIGSDEDRPQGPPATASSSSPCRQPPGSPRRLRRDEFTVDHDERTRHLPGRARRPALRKRRRQVLTRTVGPARSESRCTTAKARSFSVGPNDAELVEARAAWRDEELTGDLSPAPPDGRALDLLARREGQPPPSLSRRRAQRGVAAPTRRGAEPPQAARARARAARRGPGSSAV